MRARVFAVVALIASTGAALAAPPTAADSKAVAQCVDAARNGGGFGGNCIGVVADPCIKAAANRDSYVADAKACAARELAVWQARLAQAVASASKSGGNQVRSMIAAAQKSWASSQDALCPLFANLDPGMTLGADVYCRLQETARRALLLERLAEAVGEH
jgi:Lysozyme inhibitor LprI